MSIYSKDVFSFGLHDPPPAQGIVLYSWNLKRISGMKKIQNIVGIVDWLGAVHSEHTGDAIRHHADFWPATHCQWRWDSSQGIWWITAEHKPNDEQLESIQNHLSKKYGIDC